MVTTAQFIDADFNYMYIIKVNSRVQTLLP